MKKISIFVIFFYVLSISGFSQALSFAGDKTESDTIVNSLRTAVTKIVTLKGIDKNKTLAVLIVEDSGTENVGFGGNDSNQLMKILINIPVIGWFMSINTTLWSVSRLAQPTGSGEFGNMFSRNSLAEAFIISELVNKGYNVVEASIPFYGDINRALTNETELRNYGRQLGADTVIIGSLGGSILKVIENENYFTSKRYFISDYKLNVRTIDTSTNRILDSNTFSGVDSVKTQDKIKWFSIITAAALSIAGLIALSESESSDQYDNY